MDTSKIIKGVVNSGRYTVTAPIVKEDYGLYLQIEGVELPSTYEVDFSNDEHHGTSVTMIGNADGVLIPHQFIDTGKDVFAFLYHVGANYGRTVYKFRIPNKVRPDRTEETPTPEEQSVIDQAISALNTAVEQTAQDVIDADASAQSASADAERAEEARTDAQNYAIQAEQARDDAQTYANNASASATASANSASQSAQIKDDVESMVDDAQASASASAQSATASANSASQASASATSASQSATSAQGYASQAQTSAQTASSKATEASGYADTASAKASESAQSASQALTYKTDAESAKTDAQTAQGLAESARDSAISAKNDAESARDEAQNIVDGISAKAEQIDANTADIASLEEDRYKPYVVDSASGSIASFTDGADNLPLKSLVVDINPVQDLHGQESPYPAGGGKNILPYASKDTDSKNGVTWTKNSDGSITFSGTCSAAAAMTFVELKLPAGDYLFSNVGSTFAYTGGNRPIVYIRDLDNSLSLTNIGFGQSANGISFSLSAETNIRFYAVFQTDNVVSGVLYPMIRLSTVTDATYAPYENLCPISGWTQVDVEQRGKNIYDIKGWLDKLSVPYTESNGYVSFTPTSPCYSSFFELPSGTKTLSFEFGGESTATNIRFRVKYANGTIDANATAKKTGDIVGVALNWSSVGTIKVKAQIEFGSTATPYSPYTGRSLTISLGQTVYGGKLDVLSGVLTIDRAMVDLGTLTWTYTTGDSYAGSPYFASGNVADKKAGSNNMICSQYAVGVNRGSIQDCVITPWNSTNALSLACRDDRFTDAATFKTAMNGVQLVYELATPIVYHLTPQEVRTLLGTNNVWVDTGDSAVEYRADTKLFIERLTAPDSADMIADANITSGQYFMVGNSLFKATANIANGSAIVVGTNCIRKSLSEALNEINA